MFTVTRTVCSRSIDDTDEMFKEETTSETWRIAVAKRNNIFLGIFVCLQKWSKLRKHP